MSSNLIKKTFVLFSFFLLINIYSSVFGQKIDPNKQYQVAAIGFYNLENLFDTQDDPAIRDEEYTPKGRNNWTQERFNTKLNHLATVIQGISTDVSPEGLAILGVAEVENRHVLEALCENEKIKDRNYQIIHYNSPDKRGIDVGLLYNPKQFTPLSHKKIAYPLPISINEDTLFTRDQLLVSGKLNNELVHIIVSHWPSRSGGEKRSRPKRNTAAKVAKSVIDSIMATDANAKIILVGDLNDDPNSPSVKEHLNAAMNRKKCANDQLFNPMASLYNKGIGSLAWRDTWNLFDQIIISPGLLKEETSSSFCFYKAKVYNKKFMQQKSGNFKGYPLRSFAGGQYKAGYSDHFPTYIYLIKEVVN